MTTFNTGNPLGSTDVYDRYDNSENLDNFSNGPLDAYADRFGVMRQSLQGIRNASQYQFLGAYAAGLQFTSMNQVFSYLGEFYAPGPAITLPYTTTGVELTEVPLFRSVGDAMLRGDLADAADPAKGAGLVGYKGRTVRQKLEEFASVNDFGAIGDGIADDTAAIQAALNASTSVFIPEGDYLITSTITLNNDQHISGSGRKSRIFTTTGSLNNGINMLMAFEKFNITIEGITVQNSGFGEAFPTPGTFTGMGIPIGLIGCTTSTVRKCYVFDGGGVTAQPGVNQGSCGIYLSNSNNCRVLDNFVQSGQNGITLDQWYSTLAGGSKLGFKLGHNLVANNTVANMAGRGIAIDDDLTQDGFNSITDNIVSLCAFASISANESSSIVITDNLCDGKYTTGRTQSTTSAPCYYGIKSVGLRHGRVDSNTFVNDLVCGILAFNPQDMSFSNNHVTPAGTDADPEAVGAIGAVCILATGSNSLSGNRVDNNYIKRLGAVGVIPGILVQVGALTANHHDMSICGNRIFKFNWNSISIPTVSTAKSSRIKVNDNILNGEDSSPGAVGIYVNGVISSEFADNLIYSFVTGAVDANGQRNRWTGKIDFCGQGFVHSSMDTNHIGIHFTNITNEAIFGAAATIGTTDARSCQFSSVGFIKSGVTPSAATGVLLEVFVPGAVQPVPNPGEIAIGGVADRIINSTPTVGQPKAIVCVVAGSPGTWVSEGLL